MKICFITHSGLMGGAERAILEEIDIFIRNGIKCYVLVPYNGPFCTELQNRQVEYEILKYKPWAGERNISLVKLLKYQLINVYILIAAIYKVKKWGCDVIYTNTITINIGAFLSALIRKPHVWHFHEIFEEDYEIYFYYGKNVSLNIINLFSTLCIAISHFVASKFEPYIDSWKIKVVYQSVSLNTLRTDKAKCNGSPITKCIIIGKITRRKRQEDAINAIIYLNKIGMKVKLNMVGDESPEYLSYLIGIIKENNIEDQVEISGYKNDVFSQITNSDLLIVCSRSEGFGRVTIEGMLAGKPVIGARSGATTELIRDGFNGLLYEPGNYNELAEKILYLKNNPDIAREMSQNAANWANSIFNQEKYGQELLNLINPLVRTSS